ncbi:RHS repeat-associated protein [Pseudomonas graminis]|nr:RHS repeat-associated protein [Pseudomonas graminis]
MLKDDEVDWIMNAHKKCSLTLGEQTFDGLGRQLSVVVGDRTTQFEYKEAQLPPSANVLPDGKRVDFTYEPTLDNQILSICPAGETANTFAYDASLALLKSSSGSLGEQTMTYTVTGQPKTDTWTVDGKEHVTTWRYALGGLLLGFDDADGVTHAQHYDTFGRVDQITADGVTIDITYDEFNRPETLISTDPASCNVLQQALTYDGHGREQTRTFTISLNGTLHSMVQTLGYNALDQLTFRQWQDGVKVGDETFAYDNRGRLIHYTANDTAAPTDPFGNRVVEQVFTFNALNGYKEITSKFADRSTDTATFTYAGDDDDPTQVLSIEHSHSSWPSHIDLTYDACGRVRTYRLPATDSRPALDRILTWDAQDRLIKVDDKTSTCDYGYAPDGQLTDRLINGTLTRSFFSGGQATHEHTGDQTLHIVGDGGSVFALSRLTAGVRQGTTLLGCDAQGSVRIEADSAVRTRSYTVHGAEPLDKDNSNPFGFAGERREPLTGWFIPSGYRPYDPIVMGFLSPDSDSPFGQGGLNPYVYCAGDPVNRIDPSGHGWLTWLVAGIGIGLGVVGTIATFGAAAPAFAALAAGGIGALTATGAVAIGAATLSAVSLGTGIASTVLEATNKDSKAASILGWVSLGTGLAEAGLSMAPKAAARLRARLGRSAGRAVRKSGRGAGSSAPSKPLNFGTSVILYERKPPTFKANGDIDYVGSQDVVFHKNWLDTKVPAFETHGDDFGNLMNSAGQMRPAAEVAHMDIAPALRDMGHPQGKGFVLLACAAGKSGAAQNVANSLNRTVSAYPSNITVAPLRLMDFLEVGDRATTLPMSAKSWGDTIREFFVGARGFSAQPGYEVAEARLFRPNNIV